MDSEDPYKMKVAELRTALENRGLDTSGLKADLQQRLQMALDEEEFGTGTGGGDNGEAPMDQDEEDGDTTAPIAVEQESSPVPVATISNEQNESNEKTEEATKESENAQNEASLSAQILTSEEKLRKRRERFEGMIDDTSSGKGGKRPNLSVAARMGLPLGSKPTSTNQRKNGEEEGGEPAKKKSRIQDFKIEMTEEEKKKKISRSERFGTSCKELMDEKMKARSLRFSNQG